MPKENTEDMMSRLRMMATDKGDTWDLSPKDQAAIRYALDRLDALDDRLIAAAPDLLAFAKAQEAWEAEFIMANECWLMTAEMLPRFNEEILGKFLQLQKVRNEAVAKATKPS